MKREHYDMMRQTEDFHWWYRVRRALICRLVASYASKRGFEAPLRILDIGCGTGGLFHELQAFGEVKGVDFSERAVAYCRGRGLAGIAVADATALPFKDESFDLVIAMDILEHLKNDAKGCSEIERVLVPGGTAIITVPAFMFLWSVTDVLSEHYRRYTKKGIEGVLKKTGMTVRYSTYFNTFLFPFIAGVRLFVKFFRIPMRSENNVGGKLSNRIFHGIFHLESLLIPHLSFPFGVSILTIVEKK